MRDYSSVSLFFTLLFSFFTLHGSVVQWIEQPSPKG